MFIRIYVGDNYCKALIAYKFRIYKILFIYIMNFIMLCIFNYFISYCIKKNLPLLGLEITCSTRTFTFMAKCLVRFIAYLLLEVNPSAFQISLPPKVLSRANYFREMGECPKLEGPNRDMQKTFKITK